ncbi:hypothetical protein BOW53_03205 [Solemya pervernicosa gill symbiont]|uniref:Lipoprotein SmpA/OmlA domain-containing protein n=2 Tax=Gammaproteobacteria incertae sedis TaxID=118884 RepID=A0A1T2L8X2_9GAMM|nr:hypothetical protein [Candidatus Reidiella endopervernicosa]OOZ41531.1 hypothetical protein BOW53_03205 [Solemya pervernicosa gill symbiont]QKQ27937.1 hypothetical protein HUE57_17850 [Candidatus Reidiella endopervernicosa]
MKPFTTAIALFSTALICSTAWADESALAQRVIDLENRVTTLEMLLEETNTKDRWKDPILWQRIKKEMSSNEIRKLLGKPARVEEAIFVTWYYHQTSKLHSYIWFDEGKVLGWEITE